METRSSSIMKKINLAVAKKDAVEPSPSKAPQAMAFLPGLDIREVQRKDLSEKNMPNAEEGQISVDESTIVKMKKRIFVRERRQNPSERVKEMHETKAEEKDKCGKKCGWGRGRGRRKRVNEQNEVMRMEIIYNVCK